ncbi:MAG: hypothetical protein MJ230_05485 [bacterium]|nr:hypothetical protein [bacterium]
MQVLSIGVNRDMPMYIDKNRSKNSLGTNVTKSFAEKQNCVSFNGKAGRILGKAVGAVTGAVAGGAIIGGGSLAAGLALLSGPIGWVALGATYLAGGALIGGYVGGGLCDIAEDKIDDKDDVKYLSK